MAGRLHRFQRRALARLPWKNGAGVTREIVRQPSDASLDESDWRVSIAEVTSDGPFSIFPGMDRTIVLLDGPGLHLRSRCAALDHRLDTPGQPLRFGGELQTEARVLGGPSEDLNVMTRRARCHADVELLRAARRVPDVADGLLLVLEGRWSVPAAPARDTWLTEGEGLWWSRRALGGSLRPAAAPARLLLVTIDYDT